MALEIRDVVKSFGPQQTKVLHGINLSVQNGEFVTIMGKSGSGKTTLLYIVSTLDQPTSGKVAIDGVDPARLGVEELHRFRNHNIGYVFQFHYLLPELTVLENVLLPARKDSSQKRREPYAMELLKTFGLERLASRFPSQISGGEQQRVAIARALVMKPKFIFADEPTGNLDTQNGQVVMDLLKKVNRELGTTLVIVTHDPDYGAMATRQVKMVDGRISSPHSII